MYRGVEEQLRTLLISVLIAVINFTLRPLCLPGMTVAGWAQNRSGQSNGKKPLGPYQELTLGPPAHDHILF
jgi:hypothetical protein